MKTNKRIWVLVGKEANHLLLSRLILGKSPRDLILHFWNKWLNNYAIRKDEKAHAKTPVKTRC
ncbi:hypothetical protein SBF1_4070005 [Candidatus Desulfosporosinus infrequens]|uniref:Uncharacterized protein n=1 Tax=Candidatus Desulfosporosinus infrequens TaxID=2043169 RepID=A0A2U3L959_9FIRM|nr:hypothetical protein SBF1_4070005 [Candidatus Desulfosporosinus infrequens]